MPCRHVLYGWVERAAQLCPCGLLLRRSWRHQRDGDVLRRGALRQRKRRGRIHQRGLRRRVRSGTGVPLPGGEQLQQRGALRRWLLVCGWSRSRAAVQHRWVFLPRSRRQPYDCQMWCGYLRHVGSSKHVYLLLVQRALLVCSGILLLCWVQLVGRRAVPCWEHLCRGKFAPVPVRRRGVLLSIWIGCCGCAHCRVPRGLLGHGCGGAQLRQWHMRGAVRLWRGWALVSSRINVPAWRAVRRGLILFSQ
jgi:hypothetical protein